MTTALLIACGAALGAPSRFLIDQYFKKFTDHPIGTFIVNTFGSFLIGLTYATPEHWHALIAVGFAGSFTTWSTFMLDIYLGLRLKKYLPVFINVCASISVGLLAAWFGISLVR